MQILSKTEATDWLPRSSSEFDLRGDLGFRNGKNHVISVPLPNKAYRLPYLANLLATGSYDSPFVESLLWFVDWGVPGEVCNRVGFKFLQSMHTDARPLIEAPARLFKPNEQVEAQSLLTLSLWMGWDAYFIPASGRYFVFNSNDEFTDVVSNDDETHKRFVDALKGDWGGKEM